jgi:hypothetical protein
MKAGLCQRGLMPMTSYELKLKDTIKCESSRDSAIKAREHILSLLQKFDIIEINLQDVNFTPSVADEIVGGLAQILGAEAFKHKIKILNASESQMALMRHVIARRQAAQHKTD